MLDAELVEPARPFVQVSMCGDAEGDMVQSGPALVERLTGVGVVVMQPDHHSRSGFHQNYGVTGLLGAVVREVNRDPRHPEYPFIPLSAGFDVGHRRREVMDA